MTGGEWRNIENFGFSWCLYSGILNEQFIDQYTKLILHHRTWLIMQGVERGGRVHAGLTLKLHVEPFAAGRVYRSGLSRPVYTSILEMNLVWGWRPLWFRAGSRISGGSFVGVTQE